MKERILFSLVVIGKTQADIDGAIRGIKQIDFALEQFEVIVAVGDNPSEQRNSAVKKAKGKWILFLDNDSVVQRDILQQYQNFLLQHPSTIIAGGPSLLSSSSDPVQLLIERVLTNPLIVGRICSRYTDRGRERQVNDLELIMCNMVIRRDIFLQIGGLNPKLYPNEENCFILRAKSLGEIWYLPSAKVFREHKGSLQEFARQMFRYGRGRTKQTLLNRRFFHFGPILTMLFTLYVITFPILVSVSIRWIIPLLIYILYILGANLRNISTIIPLMIYSFTCHFFYGLGLLFGFLHDDT